MQTSQACIHINVQTDGQCTFSAEKMYIDKKCEVEHSFSQISLISYDKKYHISHA